MNKSRKFYTLIVFLSGFLFGTLLLTANKLFFTHNYLYGQTNSTNTQETVIDPNDENYYKYFPMFRTTYDVLKREFYDKTKVTAKNLFYGAIKGMLENMNDPYTTFMDPKISKEFNIDMAASFGGLGIQIDVRDEWLTIMSPIEDTPAWRANLKPGDVISEIDGVTTKGITTEQAVQKLRGKPGSKVTITIIRAGITDPFQVTMKREEIKIKTVQSDVIPSNGKKIAYIKMKEFSMPTAEDFQAQIKSLMDKHPDGIIVDLRNNPGGLLTVVANCVNNFQSDGLIVYTRGRMPENNSEFYASKENMIVPIDLPMVVLINQGSASASEIFSGAMQDTGRAVLVGMKSYGKGSVQKTFPFPEDGSQIKYTVAKYFTPSGQSIDKIGLKPNVEEKMWYEVLSDDERNALIKIQGTNFIKDFTTANPNPTQAKIAEFQKSLQDQGFKVGLKSVQWLVWSRKNETAMPAVYDLEWDNQLGKALEVLNHYKDYKKPLKVFKDPK